jgi:D-3-phosphoglycerate dehydrogenase
MIVVPDDFPSVFTGSAAESALRALGDVTVHTGRGAEDETELIRRVGDATLAVNIRAYSKFTARVLDACPSLRLISVWGTGTDNVDLAACRARGVTVANTPGVNAHAVAEHTLALMLALARAIPAMDAAVRAGQWPRRMLTQLEGKTLGVVGFGPIGVRVAALARPFGVQLLVSTRGPDGGRAAAAHARHVPFETLLRESDIVSLHLRLTDETRGILGRSEFAMMKPSALLVNTARAGLVDRSSLIDALRGGRIAGAALDVFHQEPLPADDPLLSLGNVVLTPHDAGMTAEVVQQGLSRAVENVARFLSGG